MTQIAILPATPKANIQTGSNPVDTPVTAEPTEFAPHLAKAVAEKNKPSQDSISENSRTANKPEEPTNAEQTETSPAINEKGSDDRSVVKDAIKELVDAIGNGGTPLTPNAQASTAIEVISTPLTSLTKNPVQPQFAIPTESALPRSAIPAEINNKPDFLPQTPLNPLAVAEKEMVSQLQVPVNSSKASPQMDILFVGSEPTNIPLIEKETVLQQLQKIINSSSETGTVSIQGVVNKQTQSAEESTSRLVALTSAQIPEQSRVTDKSISKAPTLRQDINGQYLEAKINATDKNNTNSSAQNNDQQSSANTQQQAPVLQSNSLVSQDPANGLSQFPTILPEGQINHLQSSASPVVLPSGTLVFEEDVMRQVVERFRVSMRQSDTKISLKLHPAELGELKIDLTLKEGSIKANVITHNLQVREIVERNMSKLKNALEEQGFNIEEILVTSESNSVDDFNLFDSQLSQQYQKSQATSSTSRNDFNLAFEDAVEESVDSTKNGVNIKA